MDKSEKAALLIPSLPLFECVSEGEGNNTVANCHALLFGVSVMQTKAKSGFCSYCNTKSSTHSTYKHLKHYNSSMNLSTP